MKISIITCSINNPDGLSAVIRDLRDRASGGDITIEHVVVDAGQTDGAIETLLSGIDNTPHYELNWVSEPDDGLYDALNKGLAMATGDIIGIYHTDDLWEPGVLKSIAAAFHHPKDNPPTQAPEPNPERTERVEGSQLPEAIYGDLVYIDTADVTKIHRVWRSGGYDVHKWRQGWMPPHPALFITRDLADRVGPYRLDLGSAADYEWMLRAGLKHNARFTYVPETWVRMRIGGQSNASLRNRLRAHAADWKAWRLNHLTPFPWTLPMKLLRKIPQFWAGRSTQTRTT